MTSDSKADAVLKKAKEQERKYKWLEAADSYRQILSSESGTVAAETWQRIGFCYNLASRQTEDLEEFKKVRQLAVEAYKNAARIFEKVNSLENRGRSVQCNALAEYINSWLPSSPPEKARMLDECRKYGNVALKAFRNAGCEMNYGKTCNNLLWCLLDHLPLASTIKEKQNLAQGGIKLGNQAISGLSKLGNKSELLQAYFLASLINWYSLHLNVQEKKRKEIENRCLRYSEKATELAKEVDNPYYTALSRWTASLCTLYFTEKIESALESAKEMLQQGSIVRDNYLKGVALYLLAQAMDSKIVEEADPSKKREGYEKIIEYSQDSIGYLQLVSKDTAIADTYMFYTESYSCLAREVEVDAEKKHALLEKAVETGRKGLEHANRSGSPDALGSALHALSKALLFYSNLERGKDEKIKLQKEALTLRKEYIKTMERAFPFNYWVLGIGKNYAALIEAGLSRSEIDKDKKTAFLEKAVLDMEDAISYCIKWASQQWQMVVVAGFEDTSGALLNELYLLTNDRENLTRAIEVHQNAAEKFRKANFPSRAAESHWKIASIQDRLGEHQKAAKNFENAFAEYKAASRRLPQFEGFYLDYAVYMKAWNEIQTAKSAHNNKEYTVAMKQYEETANLLKQSKMWGYLSPNFLAWAFLEQAEDLSRKENSTESIEAFKKASELLREAERTLRAAFDRIENADEKDLAERLIKASDKRGKYCLGRIAVEEAKTMDRQGDHTASSEKYGFAAETFQKIAKVESEQTRRELKPLIYLCQAWQKMMMAEARASPIMYEEASELFKQAKEHSLDQPTSLLALAHSSFCKALEAGTEFEMTRDMIMYSTVIKHMEAAANYYLKAGFKTASEYAKATQRLFDAYVYMDNAKRETDPEKEARYYTMAEKVLQASARSYTKAQHYHASQEVQRLLDKVREERELAVSLSEVLHAPAVTSSTASFVTLTPSEEIAVGLERFEHADVQAKLIQHEKEIRVGEDFNLEIQIVNVGKEAVLLAKVEEILPAGFQLVAKPDYCHFEDAYLDTKGKRLDPLKTEEISLVLRSSDKGTFEITPRIVCVDETGHHMFRGLEPATINVLEVVLPGRITTGFEDLDNLLFGGIPENYAVILTSPSCDEKDLLIKRFLEAGAKEGQITFHVTIEASGVEALAEDFQSNFYVFICNPRADIMIKSLPNVFKLKSVENLTDIDIALTKAFRRLDESMSGPRRACIEIVSDVLLQHHAVTTRRWLTGLIPDLRSRGFTTLAVTNPQMHPPQEVQAILGLFDGEINIHEKESARGLEKSLKIRKMYNQRYLESELPLRKEKLETRKNR
jgi:KaiC/GvpD/RAD55 family RecA-like ATPase